MQDSELDMEDVHCIDSSKDRYPFCIVWTPLPFISWFLPWIGHMGIAKSNGVIRDFGGPYYVAEDNFTFGRPTKYWQLDPKRAGGVSNWDSGVHEASEIYKGRMHNICCDNCHSHVATALNLMKYGGASNWNMVYLAGMMLVYSKFTSFFALIKTWGPFTAILAIAVCVYYFAL